jgi:hypothetical protein
MSAQGDIYIFDGRDKKALEARLMELSDLFWDLFEQKRLPAVCLDPESSPEIPTKKTTRSKSIGGGFPTF